ncbi:beta-propeller fold lactonase family protein [Aquincola sp. S2]|uniref:Beta-propeller fold lactonase family protein n=1 Tax=Pseudaquabacterium terrae TaxID=2732868 RepID=A0ABX2EED0_9BURK|nr:beta-propeller fold lactonase family protein [Aquabacterium terrae]NRF66964.1 beta-propeller fold lactonase family protein [Aquabacterium terrae]
MVTRSLSVLGAAIGILLMQACSTPPRSVAYVANADSREISVLALDGAGAVKPLQTVPVSGTVMPLALSPDQRFLYAALRSEPYTVASFAIDRSAGDSAGQLKAIGQAPLPDSMAYIATDKTGRWLFAASYGGHKLSVSPIGADGVAGAAQQILATGKNAHAAVPDAAGRHLYVTNLGSDQVMQWRFDAASGALTPTEPPALALRPGSGARHLVLHPNGRHAYLLNELDASVELLDIDAQRGTLTARKHWSSLPPGFGGKPWAADLHLTPDGRHLYTSERTTSTLAMWKVNATTGELTLIGHQPTEKQPRGFRIDPSGRWLLAVGQLSHQMSVYRIDADSGRLAPQTTLILGKNPNWVEIVQLP